MTVEEFIRQLEKIYKEQDYRATLDFMDLYSLEMWEKMTLNQCEYVYGEIGESCMMLKIADEYEKAQAEGREPNFGLPLDEMIPAVNEDSDN